MVRLLFVVLSLAASGCSVEHSCTDELRGSSIKLTRDLDVEANAASRLVVEACVDGQCNRGTVTSAPAATPVTLEFQRSFATNVSGTLSSTAATRTKLDVTFLVSERREGDRTDLRVRVLDGTNEILSTGGTVGWTATDSSNCHTQAAQQTL
jgi:hypothetical protein